MAPNETDNIDKKVARNQAKVARPEFKVVTNAAEGTPTGGIRTKDLIDTVAAATGAKKPEVKKIVEATLVALGKALATGNDMFVPPLGKLRVVKDNGIVLTLKLRLADEAKAAGLALADEGEDS